jgi:hypothetical protein
MNFLKKFEMPPDFKKNFHPDIFKEKAKTQLNQYKKSSHSRARFHSSHNLPSKSKII